MNDLDRFFRLCVNSTKFFFLFLLIFISGIRADSTAPSDAIDKLGSVTEKSFRLREITDAKLVGVDGTIAIQRPTQYQNEVTFLNRGDWRVKRELPYTKSIKEYLRLDGVLSEVKPSGILGPAVTPVTESVWAEVVLSAFRVASSWGLSGDSKNLSDWIKFLKDASTSKQLPLKNAENDRVDALFSESGDIRLKLQGSLLQDGKTKVLIESLWEMTRVGQIVKADLGAPLLGRPTTSVAEVPQPKTP